MPISFSCPYCSKQYRVADSKAGKRVACKDCNQAISVPGVSRDTAPVKPRRSGRASTTKILPENRYAGGLSFVDDEPKPTPRRQKPREPEPEPDAPKMPPSKLKKPKLPQGLTTPKDLPKLQRPAGRKVAEIPKRRSWNLIWIAGSLALGAGFFMPWFTPDLDAFSEPVMGFMLPLKAEDLLAALLNDGNFEHVPVIDAMSGDGTRRLVLWSVYLLPLLALFGIVSEIRAAGKGKSRWYIRIFCWLAPVFVACAIYFTFRASIDLTLEPDSAQVPSINLEETVPFIGYGAYTMAGGWLIMLLGIFIAPKVKKPELPKPKASKETRDAKAEK